MKNILRFISLVLATVFLVSCRAGSYKDGVYSSRQAEFDSESGWKDIIQITVLNGKITAVDWNSVHRDGGNDKKTQSKSGEYNMPAEKQWHEQAKLMEEALIREQNPDNLRINTSGLVDGVSGVTIHVSSFVPLAKDALKNAK